jgi:dienelactone hydrolase
MKRPLAALLGLMVVSAAPAAVPQVPIEMLFGTNYVLSASLSPDGQKVAFLAPSEGTYGLAILDLATHKVTNPIHVRDENVDSFFWKGNERLIFTGLIGGIEGGPQVASTDVDGKRVFSLLKAQKDKFRPSIYSGALLSARREDPDHIVALGYSTDSDYGSEDSIAEMGSLPAFVLKINVVNGNRSLLCPAGEGDQGSDLSDFGVDHQGEVRTASRSRGNFTEFLYRDRTTDPWKSVRKFRAQSEGWDVIGFAGEGGGVYVVDRESSDLGALRLFDPTTGALGPVLFTSDEGEIDSLVFSPDGKRLIGLRYTTDKLHFQWFEPKYANLQAKLDHSFPGQIAAISSISDDETRILVRTISDRDLGAYYLLDLTKGSLGIVTKAGPKIDPKQMAPKLPISYAARDGLTIHGYLTLPVDYVAGARVPMILHPHGGPFTIRDDWTFDPEVQFLANRGYAVLQINFRGSGGYGTRFLHAGYRQWGGTMQDDLTDGVKWAIDKGYADPSRVAVFGASYGGYATLAGLVYTPELYKCGINYVGVSDLVELVRRKSTGENAGQLSFYRETIGEDHQFLYDHSPVNFVERIRVPLLNAYGENDDRVNIAQWAALKGQLDKYHKDYDYMLAKGEGHGFRHDADAVAFYSKVEAFLKKNL